MCSATYDREIDGLKDCLEKARTNSEEQAALLEGESAAVKAGEATLGQQRAEHDSLGSTQGGAGAKRAEQHLRETVASAEEWRLKWEGSLKAARSAEAELQGAKQALKGGGAPASDADLQTLRAELATEREKAAARADRAAQGTTLKARQAELQGEMETLRFQMQAETEAGHSQQLQLQNALSEVRAGLAVGMHCVDTARALRGRSGCTACALHAHGTGAARALHGRGTGAARALHAHCIVTAGARRRLQGPAGAQPAAERQGQPARRGA